MIELAITTFVTLFVIIDPIGLAPIFIALTQGHPPPERRKIALRACLIGAAVLALFGIAGEKVLGLVGIGLPAFRIAGGLLLFIIAVEMLFERRTERREKTADQDISNPTPHDPSVFPLATPLLAGPGALATMILIMGNHSGDFSTQALLIGVMLCVVATAYVLFLLSGGLERILGQVGITVVTRLLGMLLAALAVQFVLDGMADSGLLANGAE
ncbi:MarC family protein [Oceanibium sediminis]|uniref:MarC family protein n=1 Tax=Oceanibium sediminis TaxID=2026339 RepID=UPI000DD481A6|nr:MarC family protein [Oceanibium sediminis]